MSNVYQKALVEKAYLLLVQLQKEDELDSHIGDQVRILKSLIVEDKLEQALEQAELVAKNAKVLSSNKIVNLCNDIRVPLIQVIKMQEKEKEQQMRNIYSDAGKIKEEAKKASVKEANLEVEMKCESVPSEIKMVIKGVKINAYGNELEMEEMNLEGSADILNFIMMVKAVMSKK